MHALCPDCNRKLLGGLVTSPSGRQTCKLCASAERDGRPAPGWWDHDASVAANVKNAAKRG
jgi:hypothetical protein